MGRKATAELPINNVAMRDYRSPWIIGDMFPATRAW